MFIMLIIRRGSNTLIVMMMNESDVVTMDCIHIYCIHIYCIHYTFHISSISLRVFNVATFW